MHSSTRWGVVLVGLAAGGVAWGAPTPRGAKAPTTVEAPRHPWQLPRAFLDGGLQPVPRRPGERERRGPTAKQRAVTIKQQLAGRLAGRQARALEREWARADPADGARQFALSRTLGADETAAFDGDSLAGDWSSDGGWSSAVTARQRGDELSVGVSFKQPGMDQWRQLHLTAAPDGATFSSQLGYDDAREWGTRYEKGQRIGRLFGRPVMLTESYTIARSKPRGLLSLLSYIGGSGQSKTKRRVEVGRLRLPTFGLAKRLAARGAAAQAAQGAHP